MSCSARGEVMQVIKPAGLRRGDTIGVVVPAGPVDRERIDRALTRLRDRGFRIKTYRDIYRSHGYLAGDDCTRASELMEAFTDPSTTAVWCARGGYGVVRILDRIDFDVIRRNPKVFIGFSDITALHAAIQARCGLITFHGPNLQDGFGRAEDMTPATETMLWKAVMQTDDQASGEAYVMNDCAPDGQDLDVVVQGIATGRLVGGNLAVLCGLMGTSFDFDTRGRILFLEDIDERLYRSDRFLSQLKLAGKLHGAAGVLMGSFTFNDRTEDESDEAVKEIIHGYVRNLGVPVLAGLAAGHERKNITLPMNALVTVDADQRRLVVCEATVTCRR
jgi:muramoyltetrapeptide carboxypeptidase